MTQTIELPVGPCAQKSHIPIPQSVSIPQSAKAHPSALNFAERDQERSSLADTCKVVAFLILGVVARSALTHQPTSHLEGVSEPPVYAQRPEAAGLPDLIDLSTVGF